MAMRFLAALGAVVASMLISLPAAGQPAPADLDARLKEIERDPRQFEAMSKSGRKVAAFCANCHGDGGNSVKTEVPNLAGQNLVYLLGQVKDIGSGARKSSEFHTRLIKVMKPDEKIGMIAFYAGQEVTPQPVSDPALAKKGAALYEKKCVECHEADGRGTRKYARIAGQQTVYLTTMLKSYREATGPRAKREMEKELQTMSDADIAAVVAYVSSMK